MVAEKPGEKIAIEVETGKSDVKANLQKLKDSGFDRIILLATSPDAMGVCQRVVGTMPGASVEIFSWLDIS